MATSMRFLPAVEMTCWRHVGLRSTYDKRSMLTVTKRFLPLVKITLGDYKTCGGVPQVLFIF